MPEITEHDALVALNELRCNVVGTQNAGWSNTLYPMVSILDAAGFELHEPTEEAMNEHLHTYGGAGGYPGHYKGEGIRHNWNGHLTGARENLVRQAKKYLADPSERHRGYLENAIKSAEEVKR